MLKNYIDNLKKNSGLTYVALTEKLGISWPHMMRIRKGLLQYPSFSMLTKISEFEKREPIDVLYDIMFLEDEESILANHSKCTLLFLCRLWMNNYEISLDKIFKNSFYDADVSFEGYAYKKRSKYYCLVVDSWSKLVIEHKMKFKENDNVTDLYIHSLDYIEDVYMNAIAKFYNSTGDELKKYIIILDDQELFSKIQLFNIKGAAIQVIPLLVTNIECMKEIQLDDIL